MAQLRTIDRFSLHHHLSIQETELLREHFFGPKIVRQQISPVDLAQHIESDISLGRRLLALRIEMNLIRHQNIPPVRHHHVVFRIVNSAFIAIHTIRGDLQRWFNRLGSLLRLRMSHAPTPPRE